MLPSFFDKTKIPHKPGIYIYKNHAGKVIYVGKAIDLYSRVSSYFNNKYHDPKTFHLVENINSIETIIVESELEALILEASLIKKYLPQYNIRLTDDKDYLYIAVTKEDFPRVITARKKDLRPIKAWFGPFPSSTTVKTTLKQLRHVFPWCSNPPSVIRAKVSLAEATAKRAGILKTEKAWIPYQVRDDKDGFTSKKKYRACFYYHLGLCPGACVGVISKEDYNKIINRFIKFIDGQKEELVSELNREMVSLSENQRFEEAGKVKKIVEGINYLTQPNRVSKYLENKNFLEDENHQAIVELQKVLGLPELPVRIEAYDISNISGTNATGSMVVLTNGEIDKSQYRRFKIRITGKPNDYAMHAEMMKRRLNHPEWPYPQLFLIDGGRGQVRAAYEEFKIFNLKFKINEIPFYGLAKRFEWVYPPFGEIVKLSKRSLALRLLQKIRDESHRFAITYHRKLRSKAFGV